MVGYSEVAPNLLCNVTRFCCSEQTSKIPSTSLCGMPIATRQNNSFCLHKKNFMSNVMNETLSCILNTEKQSESQR